ncbi:hypothetical protein PTI98_000713 [Pleurotus ostreatus]|nr:hypothetical protein PTI98_000713 [Pleurotus ostreatus]
MSSTSLYASPFVAGSTNTSPFSLDSFKDPQAMPSASSSSSKFSTEREDDDEDVPLIVLKTRYLLSGRTAKVGQGLGLSMVPGLEEDRQEQQVYQERGFVSGSTAKVGQGLGISMVPGLEGRQERSVSLQRKKSIHHLKGSKIRSGRRGAVTMKIIESYFD